MKDQPSCKGFPPGRVLAPHGTHFKNFHLETVWEETREAGYTFFQEHAWHLRILSSAVLYTLFQMHYFSFTEEKRCQGMPAATGQVKPCSGLAALA